MSNEIVQSVQRAFTILQAVSKHADGVGVSIIAKETNLHTSTVSRLITTLESVNALSRIDGGSQLVLGEGLIDMVGRAPWTERMIVLARPHLAKLAAETRESVGLTRLDNGLCHVFFQIESQHHIRIRDWTGHRFPLHVTSSGKLWMANWPEKKLRALFDNSPEKIASKTIVEIDLLKGELEQIQKSQVAWTIDELEDGLISIAVSIPSLEADQPAAAYLSAPAYRFTKASEREKLADQMREAAQNISTDIIK